MDSRWRILYVMFVCCAPAFPALAAQQLDASIGLPRAAWVVDNSKARLGERLFFDRRLSADGQVSCGSCHLPEHAFADRKSSSNGHRNIPGTRNAPSLLNVAHMKSLFWDGRAADLVQQARAPLINPVEHAFTEESELVRIVRADTYYSTELARLWPASGNDISMELIAEALAEYERTLLAGGSPFDRFYYAKAPGALSDAATRGLELFRGRGNCVSCHPIGEQWSLFTDHEFHVAARGLRPTVNSNLAALAQRAVAAKNSSNQQELERLIATDAQIAALGRFLVTLDPADIGRFKTPSLRNVALTAPYMHDGSVETLEEAIDLELYSRGAVTYPIILTLAEKSDLVEFLKALTGARVSSRVSISP